MEVKQIYDIVNSATQEILGESVLLKEDLSNIVDIGTEVFNASSVDNYVKSLVNHIGRVVFVNRKYSGRAPSVLMDSWEYGSVLQKITMELPEATEDESWELVDQSSYDPNVFTKPKVSTKFFNKRTTFEIPMSITEMQVKESFSNPEQLNGFVSMIYNAIDKSMTVKTDALIMRTINNMIAETVYNEYGAANINSKSTVKAINLLYLYNQEYSKSLTAAKALKDPEFIRYAAYIIGMTASRLGTISTLFNIGGKDRFTPSDMLHIVMLADFKKSADVFLQSTTFNEEYTKLPNAEVVPYWQGSGTGYDFTDTGKVHVKTASGHDETVTGVLSVMFDRDALGVTNFNRRVTTNYNPKAEFYNNWYKADAGYFNDFNENFVVFFVA
jgi:hypothetical protein